MRRFALILPLLMFAFTPSLADPLPSGVSISGGTAKERTAILFIVQHHLKDLCDSSQVVVVRLASLSELRSDVGASLDSLLPFAPDDSSKTGGDDPGDIDGLYQDDPPTITILSGEREPDLEMTFAHEFGHHVWNFLMNGNDHVYYQNIYGRQLAANRLITEYSKDSPEEGFAEAFSYYIMKPALLRQKDAASYSYIEKLIGKLKADRTINPQNAIEPPN